METASAAQSPAPSGRKRGHEGITIRHQRSCSSRLGGRCSCSPGYQAQVWSARDRRTIRKTFPTALEAGRWRHESQLALGAGALRAPAPLTVAQAVADWIDAAESGI